MPAAARLGHYTDLTEHGVPMAVPSGAMTEAAPRVVNPQGFFSIDQSISPQAYEAYAQNGGIPQAMPPPPPQSSSRNLSNQQSPTTPGFPPGVSQPSAAAMSMYSAGMPQSSPVSQAQAQNGVGAPLYDAHDPSVYNFDLAGMNFGNHYGALEFGMLGHMSSAAMGSPSVDDSSGLDQSQAAAITPGGVVPPPFTQSPNSAGYMFTNDTVMTDWQGPAAARPDVNDGPFGRSNGTMPGGRVNASIAHGYTIGNGISGYTDPTGAGHGFPTAFAGASSAPPSYAERGANGHAHADGEYPGHAPHPSGATIDSLGLQPSNGQLAGSHSRMRDSSTVYDAVTEPYSYTAGFHALTAYLQRRFPPPKTLRIAKALASIRPSFISCTKTLNQEDLIFMEKCFQRMLWEYENFIGACATPTIVCRRTGEVAAVGNEFTILTGWRKDVLLGKEANLNVNSGGGGGGGSSGSSSRGFTTPRGVVNSTDGATKQRDGAGNATTGSARGNARPQPVFLAELLDDDSVIKFYEDFAKLAFGDSRGSVTTRCRLVKYKTRTDLEFASGSGGDDPGGGGVGDSGSVENGAGGSANGGHARLNSATKQAYEEQQYLQQQQALGTATTAATTGMTTATTGLSKGAIAGEGSIHRLEAEDGTVECICCWTVRRDVFDIPMLIVMNVSLTFLHVLICCCSESRDWLIDRWV